MRYGKAFVFIKDLCGDIVGVTQSTPMEAATDACIQCLEAAVSIFEYVDQRKMTEFLTEDREARIEDEAETYKVSLSQETQEMRLRLAGIRRQISDDIECDSAIQDLCVQAGKQLGESIDFARKLKAELSKRDPVDEKFMDDIDEWIRKSAVEYKNTIQLLTSGGEESWQK